MQPADAYITVQPTSKSMTSCHIEGDPRARARDAVTRSSSPGVGRVLGAGGSADHAGCGRRRERPGGGGAVAINHRTGRHPAVGLSPRSWFVAKARRRTTGLRPVPPVARQSRSVAVSQTAAVRHMREAARAEASSASSSKHPAAAGARHRSARRAMSRQEDVPVPVAIYGTQFWRIGNFRRCTVSFGEPPGHSLPKNGKGYREATAVIKRRSTSSHELERRGGKTRRTVAIVASRTSASHSRQPSDRDAWAVVPDTGHDARSQGAACEERTAVMLTTRRRRSSTRSPITPANHRRARRSAKADQCLRRRPGRRRQ